jgi:integrase
MTEYVYRPVRIRAGKRVRSRIYYGRYSLKRGGRIFTVALSTPDIDVARKRLRNLIVEKQQDAEGITAPRAIREAAAAPIEQLLSAYLSELSSKITPKHAKGTVNRVRRILRGTGWRSLRDVTPASFVLWRAALSVAAKTKKEYQVSLNAFLNWLVRIEKLATNPLVKVDRVETRGKMVRPVRAFTEMEIRALLAVAGRRRHAYLVLLYTGLRKTEVKRLAWGDVHLDDARPYLLAREGTTKDKDKRAVPLHPGLASELRAIRPADATADARIFAGTFPKRGSLHRDFKRAGIEQKDSLGRVVHFHAFRKTFQTFGVRYGVNQRAAQELLGHSDPKLTANAYTDVPALGLHDEVAKLPWLGSEKPAQSGVAIDAQNAAKTPVSGDVCVVLNQLIHAAQAIAGQQKAGPFGPPQVVEVAGVEPACPWPSRLASTLIVLF